MNRNLLGLALLATVAFTAARPAAAASAKGAERTVQILRENATAVSHSADIYQWDRVNTEVDRIVAAQKALHRQLAGAPQSSAIDSAIHDMRSARLNHDVDRLMATSDALTKALESVELR